MEISAERVALMRAGTPPPHPALAGGYRALARRVDMTWQEIQSMVMAERRN